MPSTRRVRCEQAWLLGCEVHAFDPTPATVEFIRNRTMIRPQPPSFHFHAVGLGTWDGMADFYMQKTAAGAEGESLELAMPMPTLSGSGTATNVAIPSTVELPVRTLSSILDDLGHKPIALMKMDIEGSEYGVLEDWYLRRGMTLPADQLLIEFHRFSLDLRYNASPEVSQIIFLLHMDGFDTFFHRNFVSQDGHFAREYGFVRTRPSRFTSQAW